MSGVTVMEASFPGLTMALATLFQSPYVPTGTVCASQAHFHVFLYLDKWSYMMYSCFLC